MIRSDSFIYAVTKILCILNLALTFAVWIPELIKLEGTGFEGYFRPMYLTFLVYALQGLLVFTRELRKWDLISASTILIPVIYYTIALREIDFLWFAAPLVVYLAAMLIIRNKISDNGKIIYLNIWNILIVTLSLVDRYSSSI